MHLGEGRSIKRLEAIAKQVNHIEPDFEAMDDAADLFFLPLKDIRTEEFGLGSIRKGVGIFLEDMWKNKSE